MEIKSYFAQDSEGNILPGSSVYLYQRGTTNKVSVYDKNGVPKENPFAAESNGLVQFSAENGEYDLRISSGGRDYTIGVSMLDTLRMHFEEVARNIGCTLVAGSFESGAVISDTNQLVLAKRTQKIYQHTGVISGNITVYAGTDPNYGTDWIEKNNSTFRREISEENSDVIIAGDTAKHISGVTKSFRYLDDYAGTTVINTGLNDATAAFANAKADLGAGTVCRLKENGVYYFAGSRPDLSGLAIYSERNATIKTNANPNIKTMTLVNDAIINNVVHATKLTKHSNVSHDYLLSAGASVDRLSVTKTLTKKLFGDSDITLASVTSGTIDTESSFTGVNNSTYLAWGSSFSAGQQGAFIPVELGTLFEAAYRQIGTATPSTSSFRSVALITSDQRVDFAVYTGQPLAKILISNGYTSIYKEITLPNGGAYSLSDDGAIVLGLRVTDKHVEFYINGTMIYKYAYSGSPIKLAFLTSWYESNLCQILHPTKTKTLKPVSSKPVSIGVVGDSISYAAWASEPYDVILKNALEHSGLGLVTTTNFAISGTSTNDWLPGGSVDITTKDISDINYILLMLGTNDVQGGVSGTKFEDNLRILISYITSKGCIPVLGVFPVWTQSGVSNVTGVTTSNYAKGGWHRQIVKMLAAELQLPLADVCAHIGANIKLYGDNIHPTEYGQVAVAAAFAEAILSHATPDVYIPSVAVSLLTSSVALTLINSWGAASSSQVPTARLNSSEGVVRLKGPVSGGADGSSICTLPVNFRPAYKRVFIVPINTSVPAYGYARITVDTTGIVSVAGSSVTPYVVWLDSVIFDL